MMFLLFLIQVGDGMAIDSLNELTFNLLYDHLDNMSNAQKDEIIKLLAND